MGSRGWAGRGAGIGWVVAAASAAGCNTEALLPLDTDVSSNTSALVGAPADPSPVVSFTQNALAVGLDRAPEPPSASAFPTPNLGTLSYGTWMADFDGDGLLDVYDVNHGEGAHLSGLWLNGGAGAFGKNLWTVAVKPASTSGANLSLSNQMAFIGDLTGDGKVDYYTVDWSGLGTMCVNGGNAVHADWSGPSFDCYAAYKPRTFGDVNGDGKIDVLVVDPSVPYDVYKDYCRTLPTSWRLNNGTPNFKSWPADGDDFHFVGKAAPGLLLDFNKDGLPDRLQGTEVASAQRGANGLLSGGMVLSLGQANGTYSVVTSGLEAVKEPPVRIEDVDEDGCLDIGVDRTGYRDNQSWYVQDRSGTSCLAKFHSVARTALPYFPGSRHVDLDVDNDGLIDKACIVHNGYGNNDGKAPGIHIFRKLPAGGYADLGAAGTNIDGTSASEFYADQLNPGDWNEDGKVDLAGCGQVTIPGTDKGIALWTSNLSTTNRWLKIKLPSVSGFFTGAATIEIFDAGFVGDASHYVTPPKVLRAGQAWPTQSHHFGVGTRATVDVRVTFPDGRQTVRAGVVPGATLAVAAGSTPPPPPPPPPGDVTPPSIDVASVTFTPAVRDDVGVASVTWSVDGVAQVPMSVAPYALRLDWVSLSRGTHAISCRATDLAGNTSTAASISVTK